MTLGEETKMFNVIQPNLSNQNCVIHSNGLPQLSVIQNKRLLAPAPDRNSVLVTNSNKKNIPILPYGKGQHSASVARRNARERNRVKQVNNGFATLRQHIPVNIAQTFGSNNSTGRGVSKKLSKVETLRLAVEYIRHLQSMLNDAETQSESEAKGNENHLVENHNYAENYNNYNNYPVLIPTPSSSEVSSSPSHSQTSEESSFYHQHSYNNFESKSPEDEELLDAIFSWQNDN